MSGSDSGSSAPSSAPSSSLLTMPIRQAIWSLAWPTIVMGWLRSSYFLANSFWVSSMGRDALAAIGGCAFATWIAYSLMEIAATGVYSEVAQATGAGDRGRVQRALGHGLLLATGVGLLVTLLLWYGRGIYLEMLGVTDPTVRALGLEYLGYTAIGSIAVTWFTTLTSAFRGLGNARAPLWMYGLTLLLNVAIDPLMIYGGLGWKGMGIGGAALATVLAHGVGVVTSALLLRREGYWPTLGRIELPWLGRIAAIGLPVAVSGAGFSFVYVLLGREISRYGSDALAAVGLGHRIESLIYLACVGFQVAGTTLVGQWVGAGDLEQAAQAARAVRREMVRVVLVASVLVMGLAPQLVGIFSPEPEVVRLGSWYLWMTGSVAVLMGLEALYEGAFAGVGKTMAPLLIAFPLTALRIPLAHVLAVWVGWGAVGVWVAIALSTLSKGLLMMYWFERGGWRRVLPSR